MIRIVRFVKNVVERRKQVAGKVAESCAGLRIGSDGGSDRICELGKKPDPNRSLAHRRLGEKEGRFLRVGVDKGIGSEE